MTDKYELYDEDEDEDLEEGEIVFEPDEALILALNEIHSLKELIDNQQSAIDDLKDQLKFLRKKE